MMGGGLIGIILIIIIIWGVFQFAGKGVMNNPFNNNRIGNMPNKENALEILKKVIWYFGLCSCTWRLDTLVFAGGIGENCPVVRSRICEGLGFLGIELEENRNKANALVISKNNGRTTVRLIHTDEELMIAKTVIQIINHI